MISDNALIALISGCLLTFVIFLTDKSCNCHIEQQKIEHSKQKLIIELDYELNQTKYEICQKQGECWKVYYEQCLKHTNNDKKCINIIPIDQRIQYTTDEDEAKMEKVKLYNTCLSTNPNLVSWCEKILH